MLKSIRNYKINLYLLQSIWTELKTYFECAYIHRFREMCICIYMPVYISGKNQR